MELDKFQFNNMFLKIITKNKIHTSHAEKGFTLVELLISIGVFLVVMTISLGSIISILDAGRKARSLKEVMTNLNFATEVMSREIKFGRNYFCGVNTVAPHAQSSSCSDGGTSITFTTSEGVDTIYRLNGTQIEKSVDNGVSYIGVTSPEVTVEGLTFYIFNTAPAPNQRQPRMLMHVRGYAGVKPTVQSRFTLQTVMSQRSLNLAPVATPSPSVYTYCADEGGTCTFAGVGTVRYGASGSYFYQNNVNGSIACTNAVFGDPIVNTAKFCYYILP